MHIYIYSYIYIYRSYTLCCSAATPSSMRLSCPSASDLQREWSTYCGPRTAVHLVRSL